MKYISQFFQYLIEIIVMLFIFNALGEIVKNHNIYFWQSQNLLTYEFLSKNVTYYAMYQFLVFSILTLSDSSKKDSLLAIITFVKKIRILISGDIDASSLIDEYRLKLNDESVMFDKSEKEILENIKIENELYLSGDIEKNEYIRNLDLKLVELEHIFEHYSLNWRLSFILRIRK